MFSKKTRYALMAPIDKSQHISQRYLEGIRSGRWWWENPDHRECGLHSR